MRLGQNRWPKRIRTIPPKQLAVLEKLYEKLGKAGQEHASEPLDWKLQGWNPRTINILFLDYAFIGLTTPNEGGKGYRDVYLTWRGRGYLEDIHKQQKDGTL